MKALYFFFIALLVLLQAGCMTYDNRLPMPKQDGKISFEVSDEEISSLTDLPIGAYLVSDSQVVISGHQTGGGAGVFFGLIGVLIEHSAGVSAGKRSVGTLKEQLKFKLNSNVEERFQKNLQEGNLSNLFSVDDSSLKYVLEIKPMLVLTHTSENKKIRPFTILNTTLRLRNEEKEIWGSRYISSLGESKLLSGENSWLDNDKEALIKFIDVNIEASIQFMLKDFQVPYAREEGESIVVEGHVPYMKDIYQLLGSKLAEDNISIAYSPKIPDLSLFSGIIIADKKQVSYRSAAEEDSGFSRVKSEEEKIESRCIEPYC